MAHIQQHAPDSQPALSLMIRPWAPAAVNEHVRLILGDAECAARDAVWVEIGYGLEGAPLTYLRHVLQVDGWRCAQQIERLLSGTSAYATWRSGCPPALLMARPGAVDGQGNAAFQLTLQMSLGGLTDSGQQDRSGVTFALDGVSEDALRRFGETLDRELEQALDPLSAAGPRSAPAAAVPPGLAANPFGGRLNAAAYNALGRDYSHDYLAEPFFRRAFEGWLHALPPRARVLDIGCGHGQPVAAALTAAGHRVTGIDTSAEMIAQARTALPAARFQQLALTDLDETDAFDAACCFFSFLCMDPIELRIGLERLHKALKPGAAALIVSGTPDLYTRRSPLRSIQGQTTWEWPYDHEEMAAALTERAQWRLDAPALRYYDSETLEQIEPAELDPAAPEIRARACKGVYALVAKTISKDQDASPPTATGAQK